MGLLGFLCRQDLSAVVDVAAVQSSKQPAVQQSKSDVQPDHGITPELLLAKSALAAQPANAKAAAIAAALRASTGSAAGDTPLPPAWSAVDVPLKAFTVGDVRDAEELVDRAALPDFSLPLRVVSLESLRAAFKHAPQAIAVVKISRQGGSRTGTTSDGGTPHALPPGVALDLRQHSMAAGPFDRNSSTYNNMEPVTPKTPKTPKTPAGRGFKRAGMRSFPVRTSPHIPADENFSSTDDGDLPWSSMDHHHSEPASPSSSCGVAGRGVPRSSSRRKNTAAVEEGEQLAQLEPVFLNEPLKRMLDIQRVDEYSYVMDRQLLRNPMMVMLFENSVRRLLAGKATSVRQYMPYFSSPTTRHPQADTTFLNLCITTCALREEVPQGEGAVDDLGFQLDMQQQTDPGLKLTPALFLWYDDPSHRAELTSQLKRDYMALSHIPSMVTMLALDGRVLHQNGCSVAYMGFMMGSSSARGWDINDPDHTLRRLFVLEPDALEDMLTTLADNKTWHALLQMPAGMDLTEPGREANSRSSFSSDRKPKEADPCSLIQRALAAAGSSSRQGAGWQAIRASMEASGRASIEASGSSKTSETSGSSLVWGGVKRAPKTAAAGAAAAAPDVPDLVLPTRPAGSASSSVSSASRGTTTSSSSTSALKSGESPAPQKQLQQLQLQQEQDSAQMPLQQQDCQQQQAQEQPQPSPIQQQPQPPQQQQQQQQQQQDQQDWQQEQQEEQVAVAEPSTRRSASAGGVPSGSAMVLKRRVTWQDAEGQLFEPGRKLVLGRSSDTGVNMDHVSVKAPQSSRAVQMAVSTAAAAAASLRASGGGVSNRSSSGGGAMTAASHAAAAAAAAAAEADSRWHQVQASKFQDPVTGQDVIMFIQTDASARVRAEQHLRQVLDAEHSLLESIFPRQVLETMTAAAIRSAVADEEAAARLPVDRHPALLAPQNTTFAMQHEQVSIMFADIVGFTTMAKHVEPVAVMTFLNDLYTKFDALLGEHSVYKVETIGDCYMVAGGLVFTDAQGYTSVMQSKVDPLHAKRVFSFAKAMLEVSRDVLMPDTGLPVQLRVGIHSGPVVSGVVGTRMPRFCLFGDTVNTANRMESTASPNSIHVSDTTQSLIGGDCWEATGGVQLKGRGMMESYMYKI